MAKHQVTSTYVHDHGRGKINDNAVKALVTSKLFKSQVEQPKKGKGSYNRKHIKGALAKGQCPF
ncbi:alternative ribosome rescue factor ArfA [Shewanella waksmanii]|uniref:alternative ribosome rescue factor ArfA n=1 Tax=Shewanella waksmanii TaxID=213783 RepID=UPI003735F124